MSSPVFDSPPGHQSNIKGNIMLKPNSTYRMSKAAKTYLAFNWHRPSIRSIMRATVEAELADKIQPRGRREKTND